MGTEKKLVETVAKPAFIYAFDNLGPDRFTELCGLLLASRFKGFLLGGVGADGGIDGELDEVLGIWKPESISPLIDEIIQPDQLVIFQFKHKVTARVGQTQARQQLLSLFRCSPSRTCELHRRLVAQKQPDAYVLVTNVEANSVFRSKFVQLCQSENPQIKHYQVVGLDELETWVTMEPQLRHLYFPTIFGLPRFSLQVRLSEGAAIPHRGLDFDYEHSMRLLVVSVLNTGTVPSYVSSIVFRAIVDGDSRYVQMLDLGNEIMKLIDNPKPGTALEAGRKHEYRFPFDLLRQMSTQGQEVFPVEVLVVDEIGNTYSTVIPENLRDKILG